MRLTSEFNHYSKMALIVILFASTACGAASVTESGSTRESQELQITNSTSLPETSTTTIPSQSTTKMKTSRIEATTGSFVQDGIFFPVQKGPRTGAPDARAVGKLTLTDGRCLRLKELEGYRGDLLIWPPDYSLYTEGGFIRILDENDKVVAEVGDYLDMGGGIISLDVASISKNLRQELPKHCPPPYFLVGFDLEVSRE